MKIDVDFQPLDAIFKDINRQNVVVGILNKTQKTATPDYTQPTTVKRDPFTGNSYENSKIKASKGKKITVAKLALILDKKYGIISDVFLNSKNKELKEMVELFAIPVKTQQQKNQLQNLAKALIKNPILRRDYGSNSLETQAVKGFNRVAMDTGRLFRAIKARYYLL